MGSLKARLGAGGWGLSHTPIPALDIIVAFKQETTGKQKQCATMKSFEHSLSPIHLC